MTKFKSGISGNPGGRPSGKTAGAMIRKAIEQRADEVLKSVIDAAVGGDMQAAKMLLDRITPPLKSVAQPVNISAGESLHEQGAAVIKSTLNGTIPPDVGAALIKALAIADALPMLKAEKDKSNSLKEMTEDEIIRELELRGLPTSIFDI